MKIDKIITIISRRRAGGKNNGKYLYLCSDGVERSMKGLAIFSKTSNKTIELRIKRHGMTHKNILSGYIAPGQSINGKIDRSHTTNRGNTAWQALDDTIINKRN